MSQSRPHPEDDLFYHPSHDPALKNRRSPIITPRASSTSLSLSNSSLFTIPAPPTRGATHDGTITPAYKR